MPRYEAFIEGFIYTIQKTGHAHSGGTSNKHGFCLEYKNLVNYHLYKNLFRLTWKNSGSYMRVFTL